MLDLRRVRPAVAIAAAGLRSASCPWPSPHAPTPTSTGRTTARTTIGRANLDGTGVDQSFITGALDPPLGDRGRRRPRLLGEPTGRTAHGHDRPRQPRRHRRRPELHHRRHSPSASRSTPATSTGRTAAVGHDRPRQPRRHRRRPELHHRRQLPRRRRGRRRPRLLGELATARSAAPTSTAPASTRASSPAPMPRRASRSTPATSTGRTSDSRTRSAAPTSTAPASTRASSPAPSPVRRRGRRRPRLLDERPAGRRPHGDRPRQPRRHRRRPSFIAGAEAACVTASPSTTRSPDTHPPQTKITKGAPNKTDKTKVKFKFTSSEPDSTFECKLDKKPFKPCTSPKKVKRLEDGKHKFKVRAIDAAGNVDPLRRRTSSRSSAEERSPRDTARATSEKSVESRDGPLNSSARHNGRDERAPPACGLQPHRARGGRPRRGSGILAADLRTSSCAAAAAAWRSSTWATSSSRWPRAARNRPTRAPFRPGRRRQGSRAGASEGARRPEIGRARSTSMTRGATSIQVVDYRDVQFERTSGSSGTSGSPTSPRATRHGRR